jgi:hypothetical protein
MIKKLFFILFSMASIGVCCSCSNMSGNDEEYRTIPVTNNPLIVPDTASPLPGFPAKSSTPR